MIYDLSKVFVFLSLKLLFYKKRVKCWFYLIVCVWDVFFDLSKCFYVNECLKYDVGEYLCFEYINIIELREKKMYFVKIGWSMLVLGIVIDCELRFCFYFIIVEYLNKKG